MGRNSCLLNTIDNQIIAVIRPAFFKQLNGEYIIRCEVIREIRMEMIHLLNNMAREGGFPLWPPENAEPWCTEIAGKYYRAIASFLTPEFDPMVLTSYDRHTFFVCSEPVTEGELQRLGLSRLEQLMDFGVEEPSQEPQEEVPESLVPSTGKQFLDILADVTIFFQKKTITDLCLALSPEELVLLTHRAGTALDRAYKEAEKKGKGESATDTEIERPMDVSKILGGDFSSIEGIPDWLREEDED